MKKSKTGERINIVYSTNPEYQYEYEGTPESATLPPPKQQLRISLDKKYRSGKQVTLVAGFVGTNNDLLTLTRELKAACGVGGSTKDGEILIQGDFRGKILQQLLQKGYRARQVS
jgi:translation initiation factor 1